MAQPPKQTGHKWTDAEREAARERYRASHPTLGVPPGPPSVVAEPVELPVVGDLLPTLDDLEQVMLGVDQPTEAASHEDASSVIEAVGALGPLEAWTTPEATRRGKNFVEVKREWGGKWTTVYDHLGNDHRMLKEDVPAVIGRDLAPHQRRYLRCPRCQRMENQGIHRQAGPNGCPARPKRLMTYCDICSALGRVRVIYEQHAPDNPLAEPPIDTHDPLYRPPKTPNLYSREEGLQMELDNHIRAFHPTAARQRGLRRD